MEGELPVRPERARPRPPPGSGAMRAGQLLGPDFEVYAVFDAHETARTAAWRLSRAGLRPERVLALSRAGRLPVGPRRRAGPPGGGVAVAVAAGVLCAAAGRLLFAVAGGRPDDSPVVAVLLLVMAGAGALVVGLGCAHGGVSGVARAVRAAGPSPPPGPILFAVQTATAEQAEDVRTILRQYGGAAVSVYRVDSASGRTVGAAAD